MDLSATEFLKQLFKTAVGAADPQRVLPKHLPDRPKGRTVVIGAGKAAASMASAVVNAWEGELTGLVITRYGHGLDLNKIEVVEAAHPVPDGAGRIHSIRMLELVDGLCKEDLVLVLISGGASSLLSLPPVQITFEEKQKITRALLKSGAEISEMNCVRKHLSLIKGGRLAAHCFPAKVVTLAISDVPGDYPEVIGSGPTVCDASTSSDALAILKRYNIEFSEHVLTWLESEESETIKPGNEYLNNSEFKLIATPQMSLLAAADFCRKAELNYLILSDSIEGEAREVAKVHAAIVRQIIRYEQPVPPPCVLLSGGETTVTVRGSGRGGRNAEFMLSLLIGLKGQPGVYALAADTDGIDGTEDNAGCLLTPESYTHSRSEKINLEAMLGNNDGYTVFSKLGGLLNTGPTLTNVNDFRAILVLPQDTP